MHDGRRRKNPNDGLGDAQGVNIESKSVWNPKLYSPLTFPSEPTVSCAAVYMVY